jgi:small GTP-binding protein
MDPMSIVPIDSQAAEIRRKLDEEKAAKVSVALFGQPGAGKSSLINKIVGKKVAAVGVETDVTTDAARYEHAGLIVVDLPGYGTKNFPKATFADRFRIRDFDLFLCVSSGKLHQADTEFFHELSAMGKVCVFVVNKHDELWEDGVELADLERRKRADVEKQAGRPIELVFTSCRTNTGLDELQQLIAKNLDGAKRERWRRSAKAYSTKFLEEKKASCERYVTAAALASAANGLNPIPGADVAVDVSILVTLFSEIRDNFGLTDERLNRFNHSAIPAIAQLANNVLRYAAKEGALQLLKSMLGRQAAKSLSRYIPFVGQVVAAGLGYAITSNAGSSYLDACHKLAEKTLNERLDI